MTSISRRSILAGMAGVIAAQRASAAGEPTTSSKRFQIHFEHMVAALNEMAGQGGWLLKAGREPGDEHAWVRLHTVCLETRTLDRGQVVRVQRTRELHIPGGTA